MTRTKHEGDSFTGSLGAGNQVQLEIKTTRADSVVTLIDGGDSSTSPATYTMEQEVFSSEIDSYQFYDSVENSTSRSFVDPSLGQKIRVTITNESGSSSQYRISLISYT